MNPGSFFRALGVLPPVHPGSLPLCVIGDHPVTITTSWSESALETAARRATPLVLAGDGPPPGPLDPRHEAWPVVAVSSSPWGLVPADFRLLVAAVGPADHDGLDEASAADLTRRFLDLAFDAPSRPPCHGTSLLDVVPFDIDEPYDVETVLLALVDDPGWLETDAGGAAEVLTAIARVGGCSVGIVASRADVGMGRLSPAGCARVERLVAWCDRGNRPFISLVDTAGVETPADSLEMAAVTRVAASIRAASMTKIAVVMGRAVGLGATIMGAVGARADTVLPWPRASFAMAGPRSGGEPDDMADASAAMQAARSGDVMDIIHPDDTRSRLIEMLDLLRGPREYSR